MLCFLNIFAFLSLGLLEFVYWFDDFALFAKALNMLLEYSRTVLDISSQDRLDCFTFLVQTLHMRGSHENQKSGKRVLICTKGKSIIYRKSVPSMSIF